ncbi:MAG: pantetheine-phosphate adenylyltransferase [Flavobacteriales bacterium]
MNRIAIFPGSFDPITIGHQNIVERALPMFDKVVVAIGENSQKKKMFTLEQRISFIEKTFVTHDKVEVMSYSGLTVDFCKLLGAKFILRGIRNAKDLDFEQAIAQMNMALNPEIETVFLVNDPKYGAINSSIVRDIHANGGDTSQFLPHQFTLD